MIKVSVLYANGPGNTFDMAYYLGTHMPLVKQKLGSALKGMAVEEGLSGSDAGTPPAYLAMGHLVFESAEAFGQAFSAHAADILSDIPNYTNIQPTIQVSNIKL